jgi:hypothetical protein
MHDDFRRHSTELHATARARSSHRGNTITVAERLVASHQGGGQGLAVLTLEVHGVQGRRRPPPASSATIGGMYGM